MKKIPTTVLLLILSLTVGAQTSTKTPVSSTSSIVTKQPPVDKSPMDMAYFPIDYPILKTQNRVSTPPLIRVIYSRPMREGRVIFGDMIEYNKVWRMGANEATEIEFFKDVTIDGKKVSKGRYTIYAIPTEKKWTIILNKDTDSWGAFAYDEKKDILRTEVPVQNLPDIVEAFSISFTKTDRGAQLNIAWETASTTIPIEIK